MNIEEAIKICKEYFPIMDDSFSPQIRFFKNEDRNYLPVSITSDKPYILISVASDCGLGDATMYDLKTMDENKLRELLRKSEQSFVNWD